MANAKAKSTRANSITIHVNDFNQLHEASQFSKVPLAIVDYFHDHDITIDGKAKVIKHHKKDEWYIIDKTVPFWTFFHLKTGKRSRNDFPLFITRETPDFNQVASGPPLRNGISFEEDAQLFDPSILYESGGFVLNTKQQQKTDYFFKIASKRSSLKHERAIYKLAAWGEESYKNLTFSIGKVGAFALVTMILFISTWWILAAFLMGIIGYAGYGYFKKMFLDFWAHYRRNEIFNEAIKVLEKEREILVADAGPKLVSDQQMEIWLGEEIQQLDQEVLQTFQWSATDIIPYDPSLKKRNTVGLNMEEWGLLQPLQTKGKADISSKHLRAFRFNGKQPLYGVYYLLLVYCTKEAIGVFSCFYDFIRSQKIQPVAKKYTYHDLARIEAVIENSTFEEGITPLETQKVVFHFFNSDSLQITLSDSLTITNLQHTIEGIDPEADDPSPTNPTKNPALKKLFHLPPQQLEGYRTHLILTSIHLFWNQQKNQLLQQPEPIPPSTTTQKGFRYV